jgi:hypothetical protein
MPDTSTEVVIASQTLGSTAATITFSSIPATYTDLRIVLVNTTTASVIPSLRINGNTTSVYSNTMLYGDGSVAGSGRNSNTTELFFTDTVSTSTTIPVMYTIDLFSYSGSTNKTMLSTASGDLNGSGGVERNVGLCRLTAAITSIELRARSSTWAAGTVATLYGIL